MATRTYAQTRRNRERERLFTWTRLLNSDDGVPADYPVHSTRTVQITGTFGTGGTVVIEGSLDGATWFTLRDPANANLSLTAAGLRAVQEHCAFVRPRVTAGDGTTNLTAQLLVRW